MGFINKLGFKWSAVGHSIFFQHKGEEQTIIAVATDNMAMTSKCTLDITKFKNGVHSDELVLLYTVWVVLS